MYYDFQVVVEVEFVGGLGFCCLGEKWEIKVGQEQVDVVVSWGFYGDLDFLCCYWGFRLLWGRIFSFVG